MKTKRTRNVTLREALEQRERRVKMSSKITNLMLGKQENALLDGQTLHDNLTDYHECELRAIILYEILLPMLSIGISADIIRAFW